MDLEHLETVKESNYYETMKEIQLLEIEKEQLLKNKRQLELKLAFDRAKNLQAVLGSAVNDVTSNLTFVIDKQEAIHEVLTSQSEDYIAMSKEAACEMQDVYGGVKNILGNLKNGEIDLTGISWKAFMDKANSEHREHVGVFNKCSVLIKNLEDFNLFGDKDDTPVKPEGKQRSRNKRSILSESTFLNTFNASDVSASSPLKMNLSTITSICGEKEN